MTTILQMRKILTIIAIIIGTLLITTTNAVVLSSLYTAKIPVTSRAAGQQTQALSQALKDVLIKVSGNANIANINEITNAVKNPNSYIRDFSYISTSDNTDTPLLLQVSLIPKSIDNLLNQAEQPIWKKNRPLVLIWLVTQDNSGPQLQNDGNSPTIKLLTGDANQRGLPIMFPMLDLTDLQQIQPTDVWAPFIKVIQNASLRYSPNAILIIRIDQSNPNNLVSHWSLLIKNDQLSWDINGNDMQTIVQNGINNITNIFVKKFAVIKNSQPENMITLTVTNLKNVGDYAKIVHYLDGLAGVTNVEAQNITASQASFNLTLNTDVDTLQRTIQLNSILSPLQDQSQATSLTYKLSST